MRIQTSDLLGDKYKQREYTEGPENKKYTMKIFKEHIYKYLSNGAKSFADAPGQRL